MFFKICKSTFGRIYEKKINIYLFKKEKILDYKIK